MVNSLQIIVYMPLINVKLPQNAYLLSSFLIKIATFDVIPVDIMNKIFFGYTDTSKGEGGRYEEVGIESTSFISNSGTLLLGVIGWILASITYFALRLFSEKFRRVQRFKKWLVNQIFFGMILRILLESYIEFLMAALIGVNNLSWNNSGEVIASLLAIINVDFFILLPALTYFMIVKNEYRIDDKRFVKRFGALYEDFKTDSHQALLYNYYFLVRRLLYAISLIFFASWSTSQLVVLTIGSYVLILYTIFVKPYKSRDDELYGML